MYYNAIFCRIISSVNVSGDVNKLLSFNKEDKQKMVQNFSFFIL
ncbi:hypothetical protein SAM19_04604 [Brevibacillus laterosporus]|nr:hypothetical protein [Brevibacillus laterosporus]